MSKIKPITIEGKIVEINNGEKKINSRHKYGYMVLKVFAKREYYSVLLGTSKLNTIGFSPRVGHWVHVEGMQYPPNFYTMIPSIKYVRVLKHIEAPDTRDTKFKAKI